MPKHYFGSADRVAIKRVKRLWIYRKCSRIFRNRRTLSQAQKEKALEKFILTLSDQQLVTGLGVLTGAFINHCHLSIYEFNVVTALAWFSSLTHLATLDVLQQYFFDNPAVRDWRVGGMVIVLIFLIVAQVLSLIYQPSNFPVPIQCLAPGLPGYVDPFSLIPIIALVYTVLYLLFSYINRIRRLYNRGHSNSLAARLGQKLYLGTAGRSGRFEKEVPYSDRLKLLDEIYEDYLRKERAAFERPMELLGMHRLKQTFRAISSYQESFLSTIGALSFSLSYGVTQLVLYRFIDALSIKEGSTRMDFGQIVALILLFLPILTAAEIYYGTTAPRNSRTTQLTVSLPRNP
jgi:hypothetical protein